VWLIAPVLAVAAVLVVAAVVRLASRARGGTRAADAALADEHIAEFAQAVASVARAAIARKHDPMMPQPGDPRSTRTSAGVILFYTIVLDEGQYRHHYSISMRPGCAPETLGRTLAACVAELTGVGAGGMVIGMSENAVYHVELGLSDAAETRFEAHQVRPPSPAEAGAFRDHCIALGQRVTLEHFDSGVQHANQ